MAWRYPWLHDVPPERPTAATLGRLGAARTRFYARPLPAAIKVLSHLATAPSEDDLTELLCQRYFRPNENWRLFAVVVALRLARPFAAHSPENERHDSLSNVGGAPYARYELSMGDEVRLHYQTWPASAGPSMHAAARKLQKLKAGPPHPGFIVERVGASPDTAVLGLEATRSASYLGAGLSQLLGYLKERSDSWCRQPSGWLVAPASEAYEPVAPGDAEVWIVASDDVAAAAVERFAA